MTIRSSARPAAGEEPPGRSAPPDPVGRDEEIRWLRDAVTSPSGPSVTLLRGEVGAGRSTVLAALGHRLRAAGTAAHQVRCLPGESLTPGLLGRRLLPVLAAGTYGAGREPGAGAPGGLERALRSHGPVVLLLDDARHADPETLAGLRSLLPSLPQVRLVLAVVPPASGVWPGAPVVDLPPLGRDDLVRLLTARLRAVPDEALADEVHRLSAGNPAAAVAACGPTAVRVLIGRAHLVPGQPPVPYDDDRFTAFLRELGAPVWRTARALSLLEHVPEHSAHLLATATNLPRETVDQALTVLTEHGSVTRAPDPGARWAFRIPLVGAGVRALVGPYERRVVSAVGVRAHWAAEDGAGGAPPGEGTARDVWLADRLVDAGGLVDRERAARDLFGVVERLRVAMPRRAAGWLTAAVETADDDRRCAVAVTDYVVGTLGRKELLSLDESVWALVRNLPDRPDPCTRQRLLAVELVQLAARGDTAGLSERYRAVGAEVRERPLAALVLAASLLGRWSDIPALLESEDARRPMNESERYVAGVSRSAAGLIAGDPTSLYEFLRAPSGSPPPHLRGFEAATSLFEHLLIAEDTRMVTELLARHGATVDELPRECAVTHRFLTGAWQRALASAGSLMAGGPPTARGPLGALVHARAAGALLAQGWPARAATVLDLAHTARLPMGYLLAAGQTAVHRFLGRTDPARDTLRRGLGEAAESGFVLGTAELWSGLTLIEAERSRADQTGSGLGELARIARRGRDCDRLTYLRTRVEALALLPGAHRRPSEGIPDARAAIAVARSLGQPFELARTLLAVARADRRAPGGAGRAGPPYGDAPAEHLLREAYDLFGELGALLWRHRTRTALREAGLPVPRQPTVAGETEALLTRLVCEGLSNRRLAEVLAMSETGVSTRLNHLYRRIGVRSRVELAAAVVTGRA